MMAQIDTELVLEKIVEVHRKLRYITTVEDTVRILLPALAESVGFEGCMLKVRDEDGLFRGYVLSLDGSIAESARAIDPISYRYYMKRAQRISNSYFASHEIDVWGVPDDLSDDDTEWHPDPDNGDGWETVYADPDWKPGQWHPEDALMVPVFDQSNDLVGVLWPDKPVDHQIPGREVVEILEVFAYQVVAALEIRRLLERTQKAAITDGLTQLHTHRHFQESLEREIAEAERHGSSLSLAMLDLDHFKRVNDQYGHPIGDRVLRQVSEILRASARDMDLVARYGGEEFAIILPRTDAAGALVQARRIRERIGEDWNSDLPATTVSIGVASYPADANGKQALILAADNALLQAKRLGRNRVCVTCNQAGAANVEELAG